jgi:hypothetical protein
VEGQRRKNHFRKFPIRLRNLETKDVLDVKIAILVLTLRIPNDHSETDSFRTTLQILTNYVLLSIPVR